MLHVGCLWVINRRQYYTKASVIYLYLQTDYMQRCMTDIMVQDDCAFYFIVFPSLTPCFSLSLSSNLSWSLSISWLMCNVMRWYDLIQHHTAYSATCTKNTPYLVPTSRVRDLFCSCLLVILPEYQCHLMTMRKYQHQQYSAVAMHQFFSKLLKIYTMAHEDMLCEFKLSIFVLPHSLQCSMPYQWVSARKT